MCYVCMCGCRSDLIKSNLNLACHLTAPLSLSSLTPLSPFFSILAHPFLHSPSFTSLPSTLTPFSLPISPTTTQHNTQVVKALLVQSKLNVPFTGGLSSYSAFLLVLAAYDRCQYSDTRNMFSKTRKGDINPIDINASTSDGNNNNSHNTSSSNLNGFQHDITGIGAAPIVTEGEVFLHFLSLFSCTSSTFNSSCQGIGTLNRNQCLYLRNSNCQSYIVCFIKTIFYHFLIEI